MGAIGLVFAPLAPLVPVACAIVMWISSWVYKYQLMFVFVSKVETGGVSVSLLFWTLRFVHIWLTPHHLIVADVESCSQSYTRLAHVDARTHGLE